MKHLIYLIPLLLLSCQGKQQAPDADAAGKNIVLPMPDPPFKGTVAPTLSQAKADFPAMLALVKPARSVDLFVIFWKPSDDTL